MALTIAVTSLKGGVGKSTITLNLAACFHKAGHKTLIVDADEQETCTTWAQAAAARGVSAPPVIGLRGAAMVRDLPKVAEAFDVVVVDSPPRIGPEARAAMMTAHLVLMPTTPGAADVWALQQTVAVLEEARAMRPDLRAVAVLNRADRTTLSKLTREALADLGIPILDAVLGMRVAFGEATLAGQGVVDYAPGTPAADEVEALTAAVLAALRGEGDEQREEQSEERVRTPEAPAAAARTPAPGRTVRRPPAKPKPPAGAGTGARGRTPEPPRAAAGRGRKAKA